MIKIVKVQIPLSGVGPALIYDRTTKRTVYLAVGEY
jgi:hypothetical protein